MQAATDLPKDTRPTILFIGEDGDTHQPLKRNLRKCGYRVLLAECLEDAIDWIGDGCAHADLVLLDLIGKSTEETLSLGRYVRRQAKYDVHTPLVVMAEKYGKDVEGTEVNVEDNDWIFYLGEEYDRLQNLLARLTA
jgi:DNA-binding response OmpR family regulator